MTVATLPAAPRRLTARAFDVAVCALWLAECVALALIVREMHWAGPVQDFWGSIPFIEHSLQGGHWFSDDLFAAQNNHRLVLPRLAFLIDYRYFDGSNCFLTALGVALIVLECLCVRWLSKRVAPARVGWLACSVLTVPLVSYNLLHTFNSQWLQCALLALLACSAVATGLRQQQSWLTAAGIACAVLCTFTTFTLTAIFPALLLVFALERARPQALAALLVFAVAFSAVFLHDFAADHRSGANLDTTALLAAATPSSLPTLAGALLAYLFDYLALPLYGVPGAVTTATLASLLLFGVALAQGVRRRPDSAVTVCLAVMAFCVCLGLSTGIGRLSAGATALGPRFGPIVLLYWSATWLLALLEAGQTRVAVPVQWLCFGWLLAASAASALDTGKRLAEDANRFGLAQMAYVTGITGERVLYENMVAEWRSTSYPGLVAALPYLARERKGVFREDWTQFAGLAEHLPDTACGYAFRATQKPRNGDPLVQMVVLESAAAETLAGSHLVFVQGDAVTGAAFVRHASPFAHAPRRAWLGIARVPLDAAAVQVVVFPEVGPACLARIEP